MNTELNTAIHCQVRAPVPLAGQRGGTLLLVEDSRLTSECVRLMFRAAGGRLRRADCLRSARRHMSLYTPDAALIDLGLPDGCGLDLVSEMARRRPRTGLIVAMSGDTSLQDAAITMGADGFLPKPFGNGALFRSVLGPVFHGLRGAVGPLPTPEYPALRDDLYLALDLLNGEHARRDYALQFISQIARMTGDSGLAREVADARNKAGYRHLAAALRERLGALPLI
jgi:CheY-like chemotaxis protein